MRIQIRSYKLQSRKQVRENNVCVLILINGPVDFLGGLYLWLTSASQDSSNESPLPSGTNTPRRIEPNTRHAGNNDGNSDRNLTSVSNRGKLPSKSTPIKATSTLKYDSDSDIDPDELLPVYLKTKAQLFHLQPSKLAGTSPHPPGAPAWLLSAPVADLAVHLHDVRGALHLPGDRDAPASALGLRIYASWLGQRLHQSGRPALRLRTPEHEWLAGFGPARPQNSPLTPSSCSVPSAVMPLLASILSTKSGICLNRSRSMSLVTSISGTYLPVATIVA